MLDTATAGMGSPAGRVEARDERRSGPEVIVRPSTRWSRRLLVRLAPPLLIGLVIRVLCASTDDVPPIDGTAYLESGRNLVDGLGFGRQGRPELHFPPLLPWIVGQLSRVLSRPETALVLVTLASSCVLLVLLVVLARRLSGDDGVAVAVAWLGAVTPGLTTLFVNTSGGSEAPSACLLIGALLCAIGARRRLTESAAVRPDVLALSAGGGICVGLAYLLRPENVGAGAVLAVALVLAAVGGWRRFAEPRALGRAMAVGAVFALPVLLLVAPYVAFLHHHTGTWQLTAKSQDASIEAWRAVAGGDRLARDAVLYKLDDSGLRFDVRTASLATLARENPGEWLGIVGTNALELGALYTETEKSFWGWAVLPWPLVLGALWQGWRKRRRPGVVLTGLVASGPILTCLAFFALPRYLTLTSAVLTVFAAWGLVDLVRWRPWWGRVAWGAALVACVASVVLQFAGPTAWNDPDEPVDHRIAAEWLEANGDPDGLVMTRAFLVQYYLDRDVLALPYGELDQVLAFGRAHGARYLVADWLSIRSRRPELVEPLMESTTPPPGLRLVHEFRYQKRLTRIYEFDPVPPPSTLQPNPLGWIGDS